MEAIRELQRKLQAAQKISNVRKISERNCVDLIQKLIENEQVRLFHTSTGKEWVTPEQLDREIRDAIAGNGGRISLTELPNELGVAIEYCESRTDAICKGGGGGLSRLHGEILSTQYLQGVAQEIEETLEEAGCIAVSDLSTRYNLPADFVRDSVIARVSKSHVVKQNSIYTSAHAARVEARVRGAVRGCTQPVALAQLAARHGLADVDQVATLVQTMLRDGQVLGKLQGATFTPKVFSDGQASRLDEFFAANQYLTLSLAKAAGVTPKDWAKSKGVDGLTLHSAFVASELVESALASIAEAVSADCWADVHPLLPPALTAADARELLQQLSAKKRLASNALVMDRVVMSSSFITEFANSFKAEVKGAAERKLTAPAKPAGKKAASQAEAADDDDFGGGGKKKGKRATKGKKGRAEDDDEDATGGGGAGGAADSGISNATITDLLAETHPELPAEISDEFCSHVQPLLSAMVAEELRALQATLQVKRKSQFDVAEKLIQERYERLALGLRGLEAAKLQETPLSQHLLRETVTEPLHALLALRWEELSGTTIEVTAASRRQWLDKIIAKDGAAKADSLTKLLAVFGGKTPKDQKDSKSEATKGDKGSKDKHEKGRDKKKKARDVEEDDEDEAKDAPADVSELYHAAANDCHIFCRKVDKKREKTALQEQRAACRERLKETPASDLVQACALGLQLAMLQDGVVGLAFPAEAWAMRLVAGCIADETLRDQALALVSAVAARQSGDGDGGRANGASAEDGDGALRDAIAAEAAVTAWRERVLSSAGSK